jgi:transposase InsO family protein
MPATETVLEDRAVIAWARKRLLPHDAARRLLAAAEAVTLACVIAIGRLRERGGFHCLAAEHKRLLLENAELRGQIDILRARLEGIPARERPHYSPQARFLILEHMRRTYLLSVEDTARRFLVTGQTLYNWLRELARNPTATAIGVLLRTPPPMRRYHDVVRRSAWQMKHTSFGGDRQIAGTLARECAWSPSRRSVGRFCKEPIASPPRGPQPIPRATTVQGRYPNHLWLADITRIPTVFPFLHLHLAVVFDAFSRLPLRAAVSCFEPSAAALLDLVQRAIREHGRPRHFVSDQGSQFTAPLFTDALKAIGVRQRFGALHRHGSIAIVERFFRTLKDELQLRQWKPWSLDELERRLRLALMRYAYCQPHSALGGRVPIEVFLGIPDRRPLVGLAPRDRPGAPDIDCPVQLAFLDPESERLPILVPTAA